MAALAREAANSAIFRELVWSAFEEPPELHQIDAWLRDHFVYQEESFEIIRTPLRMMNDFWSAGWFSGDCDDISTLAAAVLLAFNYPAKFIAIRYSHPSEFEHVFVESEGVRIDATVPVGTLHQELERMTEGM